MKNYKQMMKKHRKELMSVVKNAQDYWGCDDIKEFLFLRVKQLYEYYSWMKEKYVDDEMPAFKSIKECYDIIGELEHVWDECENFYREHNISNYAVREGNTVRYEIPDEVAQTWSKLTSDANKQEQKLWKKFFNVLSKNFQNWWD